MNFEKWVSTFVCWDNFIGINRVNHKGAAKLAWDFKQKENYALKETINQNQLDYLSIAISNEDLKKEIVRLKAMLSNCKELIDKKSMKALIDKVLSEDKPSNGEIDDKQGN